MITFLAALSGALIVAGVIGGILAWQPVPDTRRSTPTTRRRQTWTISRRSAILLLIGAAAGLLIALLTGLVAAILIIPMALVGLPYLLSSPGNAARIEKLDALEQWTRSLSGLLATAAGLEEAITLSQRSAPEAIRPEVTALASRLRARMSPQDAFRAFADDFDDETGDRAAAYLIVAAKRRGSGLTTILDSLAESVAVDVSARRRIDVEQKKPLGRVRSVTAITATVIGLMFFTGENVAPYWTPLGTIVLITLLAAYGLCLLWLRRMATIPPFPRFLGSAAQQEPTKP